MIAKRERPYLVVEVNGGTVTAVYCDYQDLQVVLVDWDEVETGGEAGSYPLNRLADMPEDTREHFHLAVTLSKSVASAPQRIRDWSDL